jgi:hypothetical protein
MLIKEAWKTVEDADQAGQLNVKATALKLIADIEGKRISMLQEIGLLDSAEIAAQIAETEHKQEILIKILKDIAKDYPDVRREIMKRLSQITGIIEPIEIVESKNVV